MSLKTIIAQKATEELIKLAKSKMGEALSGAKKERLAAHEQPWREFLAPTQKLDPDGRPLYRVIKGFRYKCTIKGKQYDICVEEELLSDMASTPKWLHDIYPPDGTYALASVLHDKMIRSRLYTYKECDEVFLHAMKHMPPRTPLVTRWVFYSVVRFFGSRYVYPNQSESTTRAARRTSGLCCPERARAAGRELCKLAAQGKCDAGKAVFGRGGDG